jgi:hypothetical protein
MQWQCKGKVVARICLLCFVLCPNKRCGVVISVTLRVRQVSCLWEIRYCSVSVTQQVILRFSHSCDRASVEAKLVFALGVRAVTRTAPTEVANTANRYRH